MWEGVGEKGNFVGGFRPEKMTERAKRFNIRTYGFTINSKSLICGIKGTLTVKQQLPTKDRLAELAAGSKNVEPATTQECMAMAASIIAMLEQESVGEIVLGIERDESDEAINQKYIDYSLSAIESLPVGTKLFAEIKE